MFGGIGRGRSSVRLGRVAVGWVLVLAVTGSVAQAEPPRLAPGGDVPFDVTGDAMPADESGDVLEVRGNVRVTRGAFSMSCDLLRYERKTDTALATGEVRASDGSYELTCRRLKYQVEKQLAIAWDDPVATRKTPAADGVEEQVELRGTQISLDLGNQRIEGLDRVELTRWLVRGGKRERDVSVRGDEVEIDQVARSSLFRGHVAIESAAMAARSERAFLEEPLDRLTLIGSAEAWSPGPGGERRDEVSGAKILHFLKQKRSIVIGTVQGRMDIER